MKKINPLIYKEVIMGYRFTSKLGVYDIAIDDIPKNLTLENVCEEVVLFKSDNKLVSKNELGVFEINSNTPIYNLVMGSYGWGGSGASILIGSDVLKSISKKETTFNTRYCLGDIHRFMLDGESGKNFLILFGLRRTGKTILIKHEILNLLKSGVDVEDIAFLTIKGVNSLDSLELYDYINILVSKGIKYLFIDEITYVRGNLNYLSAFSGTNEDYKILLSGTYSAGLLDVELNSLYDRCEVVKTTYISYEEYERLYKGSTILDYIDSGAILTPSKKYIQSHRGSDLLDISYKSRKYVETAIIDNVLHCLENYNFKNSFPNLVRLYDRDDGSLQNLIIRWINLYGSEITRRMINREFKSSDYGSLVQIITSRSRKNGIKANTKLFKERLYSSTKSIWDITNFTGYTDKEISELYKLFSRLGCLEEFGDNKKYLLPILVRLGCVIDSILNIRNNYGILTKDTGVSLSAEEMLLEMINDFQRELLESVIDVDLYKYGIDSYKINVGDNGVGEIDFVIDGNYYEIKRSFTFKKWFCRWLLNEEVRDKGSLNLVGNFDDGVVYLSEREAWEDANGSLEVIQRSGTKKYRINLLNVNKFLIKMTRESKQMVL